MEITKRASAITPSLTLAITAKAKKMKQDGISVIGFGAGEPDFNTPDYIVEAAKKALDMGLTKYTPASGTVELRKEIAAKFKRDNGLTYEPSQIVVSNGAKHSLFNAMLALVEEGDEVILPAPYWLTYPELIKLAGGEPVYVKTTEETNFKMTAEQLKKAVTKKTKALILNSPSNPTGSVYTREELAAIGKVVEDAGIYVISDEIYEKLVYEAAEHCSIASLSEKLYQHTVTVNGLSKTYAMTGWRIGYLGAPLAIAKAIDGIQSHATSNPNSIAQYAAQAALSGGKDFLDEMVSTFDKRRKYMVERIKAIPELDCIEPYGAFYVMMNVEKLYGRSIKGEPIRDSVGITEQLLNYGVAVVPGISFGDDNYLRLSYAISLEDIEEGLNRIQKFVSEVQ